MKELETERLILRKLLPTDSDDLYENWASDSETTKYLTLKTHTSKEETKKLLDIMIEKQKKNLQWGIEMKETHELIGIISAKKSFEYKCLELGYSISSKYWHQGLATEAVKRVMKYLLEECDINIIEAVIPENNIASIKVAEKCGLSLEATLKNRYMDKDNHLQNLLIYSIFKNK